MNGPVCISSHLLAADPRTGRPVGVPLTGHALAVTVMAFTADGRLLASGSHDAAVRLWNLASGRVERTFRTPPQSSA